MAKHKTPQIKKVFRGSNDLRTTTFETKGSTIKMRTHSRTGSGLTKIRQAKIESAGADRERASSSFSTKARQKFDRAIDTVTRMDTTPDAREGQAVLRAVRGVFEARNERKAKRVRDGKTNAAKKGKGKD